MSIEAKVVADSLSPQGVRLTTLSLKYPRWIHSEFMTHRMFSRNASSSRAVPSRRLRALEREYPLWWGTNIPGMQSGARLSEEQAAKCRAIWQRMADVCVEGVAELAEIGLHKQWANRPLEWFTSISVLVSGTAFANFFGVRWHADAQPEIQELAKLMFAAMDASTPCPLSPDEWHVPYVSPEEAKTLGLDTARRCSAARCARVSYLNHDGTEPERRQGSRHVCQTRRRSQRPSPSPPRLAHGAPGHSGPPARPRRPPFLAVSEPARQLPRLAPIPQDARQRANRYLHSALVTRG